MNSANASFNISSKETFLAKTRNKNLKTILLALLILVLLIASSMMILSSISNKRQPKRLRLDSYESGSSRYYCHLTRYPKLCYDSMSPIINATVLKSGPGPIFSTSLQVAINQLNNVTISIIKSTSSSNNSLVGTRMSDCRAWVHDSLSRLNKSLSMLGVYSDLESLTYGEMDNMKAWNWAAKANAYKCLLPLKEIMDHERVDGEEKIGVEEVELGVEKAMKYMVNSIWLLDRRQTILSDFYNPYIEFDDYYFDYSYSYFDFRFMVCLYSALYIFLALLYFLFWRGN